MMKKKIKILLYCTKGKPYLYKPYEYDCFEQDEASRFYLANEPMLEEDDLLNGKIIAECECDKVDYYEMEYYNDDSVQQSIRIYDWLESEEWEEYYCETIITNEYSDEEIANFPLLKASCLTFDELGSYVCPKGGVNNFYALHLSNVKVFDKLKELSEYTKRLPNGDFQVLGNAPQNMMNVCEIKYLIEDYVLISIQPQHLVNILNGKKTIEIRKSILNCLKELM